LGKNRAVVGDVVSAVAQGRGEERREPERVDSQPLQVVEARGEPLEIAGTVTVAVDERPDHDFVENRPAIPQRISLETGELNGRGESHWYRFRRGRCEGWTPAV